MVGGQPATKCDDRKQVTGKGIGGIRLDFTALPGVSYMRRALAEVGASGFK